MDINVIIIWIMMIFMVLGAIDRILGNRFGLGEEFENGFNALGPLGLAMVGVISLAPVLANILRPVVVPVYQFLGADPAMFATTLLANDMGGYPLAKQLAINPRCRAVRRHHSGRHDGPHHRLHHTGSTRLDSG